VPRWLWVAASLVAIGAATLVPASAARWPHHFWCWQCNDAGNLVQIALNVLLFVPFGAALRHVGCRFGLAVMLSAATTVTIEALQYFVITGRYSTISDCVANLIGGAAGWLLQHALVSAARGDRRVSQLGAWVGAGIWVAHGAFATAMFQPASTTNRYVAQVAPQLGHYDVFRGTVVDASVNRVAVTNDFVPNTALASMQREAAVALRATIVPVSPNDYWAPILAVVDVAGNEIAFIGERRGAFVFRARTRAQSHGLYAPGVLVSPTSIADTVVLSGDQRGFVLTLSVASSRGGDERRLVLRPALGWALWWPFSPVSREWMFFALTFFWLSVPYAAIVFLSTARSGVASFAPALTAVLGVHLVVPLSFRSPLGGVSDGIAIAAGLIAGLVCRWLAHGRRPVFERPLRYG
jgi:hypothetical protein